MKTQATAIIFFLCLVLSAQSQTDSTGLKKLYRTWIIPNRGYRGLNGILYEIKDSSVMVSNSSLKADYYQGNYKVSEMDVNKIKTVKVRRVGAQGTAILIGGLSGALVGIILGVKQHTNHGTDVDEEFQHVGLVFIPLLFTGMGVGIGAAIGGVKITIPIKGNQDQFELEKDKLSSYSLKYQPGWNIVSSATFSKLRDMVVDADGNAYHVIALGGQVWMAENLKVKHYRDGSGIADVDQNGIVEGNQYNWVAVNDNRKLCPAGWHVPTLAEWGSMYNSLGAENGAAGKLVAGFTTGGQKGQWWSATAMDSTTANAFYLDNQSGVAMTIATAKTSGLSVRCIRDK
jgi:hypothetical protein